MIREKRRDDGWWVVPLPMGRSALFPNQTLAAEFIDQLIKSCQTVINKPILWPEDSYEYAKKIMDINENKNLF